MVFTHIHVHMCVYIYIYISSICIWAGIRKLGTDFGVLKLENTVHGLYLGRLTFHGNLSLKIPPA